MKDELGNEVKVGDVWVATARHAGRGVHEFMFQEHGTVVALKRSRAVVTFPNYTGEHAVGTEIGRVLIAVDGRKLRTWADVRNDI